MNDINSASTSKIADFGSNILRVMEALPQRSVSMSFLVQSPLTPRKRQSPFSTSMRNLSSKQFESNDVDLINLEEKQHKEYATNSDADKLDFIASVTMFKEDTNHAMNTKESEDESITSPRKSLTPKLSPIPAPRKKSLAVQEESFTLEKEQEDNKNDGASNYPIPAPRKISQASEKLVNIERDDKQITAENYPTPAPRKNSMAIARTNIVEVDKAGTIPTPAPRKASLVAEKTMIKNSSHPAQSLPPTPPPRKLSSPMTTQKPDILPQKVIFRFLIILQKLLLVHIACTA